MTADDFQNFPADAGFPNDIDTSSSAYTGNRPASGARRATPGEVLSTGFQGAENAGDFLGLDTEIAASQDPAGYAQPGLDLTPPPGTYAPADAGYVPEAPAPLPEGDAVQEFAQAPSAFEFGEDLGSEEGELPFEESAKSSRKGLLVTVALLGVLGVGGYFYGPELVANFSAGTSEVASTPKTPDKTPRPKAAHTEPAPVASSTEPTSSALDPAATSTTEPAPSIEVASTPKTPDKTPVATSTTPAATTPDSSAPPTSDLTDLLTTPAVTGAHPSAQAFPNLGGPEYEWASADNLELIWRGNELPAEAMHAPAKTLVPHIGNVRVFMNSGDVVEGRLYAVGQERVWIDAAPGRIGLDATRVEHIEVLPPPPAGQQQVAGDGTLVAGGKRVRVRVPGGALFGKVLKIVGDDVTLALDDGGKVHVRASEVLELGPGRAVVVGR